MAKKIVIERVHLENLAQYLPYRAEDFYSISVGTEIGYCVDTGIGEEIPNLVWAVLTRPLPGHSVTGWDEAEAFCGCSLRG